MTTRAFTCPRSNSVCTNDRCGVMHCEDHKKHLDAVEPWRPPRRLPDGFVAHERGEYPGHRCDLVSVYYGGRIYGPPVDPSNEAHRWNWDDPLMWGYRVDRVFDPVAATNPGPSQPEGLGWMRNEGVPPPLGAARYYEVVMRRGLRDIGTAFRFSLVEPGERGYLGDVIWVRRTNLHGHPVDIEGNRIFDGAAEEARARLGDPASVPELTVDEENEFRRYYQDGDDRRAVFEEWLVRHRHHYASLEADSIT